VIPFSTAPSACSNLTVGLSSSSAEKVLVTPAF
jgi:hypothetical protein